MIGALEQRIGEDVGGGSGSKKDKRSMREREIEDEMNSMFKTKVNWEHAAEKFKKPGKMNEEL